MLKRILWVIVYSLSILIPFGIEHIGMFRKSDPCEPAGSEGKAPLEDFLYWTFTHSGFRKPRSHQVAVVKMDERDLPPDLFQDLCKQRRFLANLVVRLNEARPALIVIDKYFSPNVCLDQAANSELVHAFSTVSKETPIVLGRRTFNESEWERQPSPQGKDVKENFRLACLVLAPEFDFAGLAKSDQILSGATRLNADVRKIPLEWLAYPVNFAEQPKPIPSLALVAVQLKDPGIENTSTIRQFVAEQRHPLTSFLEFHAIPEVSAASLLCGTFAAAQFQINSCNAAQELPKALRSRIVVIGEDSERDRHETHTPLGTVPGVMLQANYIESLLDDRYFRPPSNAFVLASAFFWVFLIEALFSQMKSPEAAAALLAVLVSISLGVCWLLLAATGILTFGGTSGALILGVPKYLDARKERLRGK